MSRAIITIIIVGVVLSACFILRWQRHFIMRWICPGEIFFLESAEERNRVCDRGYVAFLKHWRTWVAVITYAVALIIPSALGFAGLMTMAATRVGPSSVMRLKLAAFLCAVIPPFFLIPLMFVRYRKWMRVFLREYLNDHGIAICLNCGYDLRAQASRYCPECGTAFDGKNTVDDKGQ